MADKCLVKVNGHKIEMEKDSGASCSLISEKIWHELGRPMLKKARSRMVCYDKHEMTQLGILQCLIETEEGKYTVAELPVIKCNQNFGLAGRDLLSKKVIPSINIYKIDEENNSTPDEGNKYAQLLGIKGARAGIKVKEGAKPVEIPARELPVALKYKVHTELNKMEKAGLIEKVESSQWASPIVVTIKPGRESIRICGDYTQVNKIIQNQTYLTPSIEVAFAKMANKKIFTKLDLSDAYYQVQLDEEAKDITTITTPFGRYRFNRLPYGIKVSPAVFQREMEKIIGEHPNIIIYQDDILIGGETQTELKKIKK